MRLSEVTAEDIGSSAVIDFCGERELIEIVDVHETVADPGCAPYDTEDSIARELYDKPYNQVTVRFLDGSNKESVQRLYATPEYPILED